MSIFLLPLDLSSEINAMMQKFWWRHKENESKIHWMSWKKLGFSKSKGGMGFRDLRCFNKALLAKQGWRLIQNPHSLAGSILKAKYIFCKWEFYGGFSWKQALFCMAEHFWGQRSTE
jgi:hypothetical protein